MRNCKKTSRIVAALLILIALCARASHAQSTFGSIRGTTEDPTGAAIPQAQVVLHSVDENTDVMTASDDQGDFGFENVKPGHYKVVATKDGFAQAIIDNV